jgi:hypothetical protein
MKTKAQLVEEILNIKKVDTKANLMKQSLSELESILSDLNDENKNVSDATDNEPLVDVEAMMQQMKEEMLAELKEQARKEVEAELKTESPKKSVEIDRNELIPIMNATNGTLIYISKKTGTEIEFSEYGDIEYIDFQELLTMKNSQRRFLDEPFIIVMDERAVEALSLTKMYQNITNPDQIDSVYKKNQSDFENIVELSPRGIKHLIISRAKKLYDAGELDSVKKITYLNKRFNAEIGQRG